MKITVLAQRLLISLVVLFCIDRATAENCPYIDGDTCEDCIPIYLGEYIGTTTDKTGDADDTTCTEGDLIDAWHCYTPEVSGVYTVGLCDSSFDTSLAIFSSCNATEIACNDDLCGPFGLPPWQSEITWTATAGATYYFRISGYAGAVGEYVLTLALLPPPTNGGTECVACTPITDGTIVGSNDFTDDRWYCYTANCNGRVTASTCENSGFDTMLTVLDACNGEVVAFDDDGCGLGDLGSRLAWFAELNETYYVQVAGFNGATGPFELTFDCDGCLDDPTGDFNVDGLVDGRDLDGFIQGVLQAADSREMRCRGDFDLSGALDPGDIAPMAATLLRRGLPVSDGDACLDCIEVSEGLYSGTTVDNTGFVDDTECADGDRIDEWLCFTPAITGTAVAGLCQSRFDTTLAVFKQCGGEPIACNDDACGPFGLPAWASALSWDAIAGERYLLRISGYLDATGDYTLLLDAFDDTMDDLPDGSTCERKLPLPDGLTSGSTDFTPNGDIWYEFTASCFGRVSISTCAAASFDTILTVLDSCNGAVIVEDDDACGTQDRGSIVSWFARPGEKFPIRLSGYNGATGAFNLHVICEPCFDIPDGDFNQDGRLDSLDLSGFLDALLTGSCGVSARCAGDFDKSGQIDPPDIAPMVESLLLAVP